MEFTREQIDAELQRRSEQQFTREQIDAELDRRGVRLGPVGNALDSLTGGAVRNAIRGPEQDIPELSELYPTAAMRLALGRNDEAKAGIFETMGPPGQVAGKDADGNIIVQTHK